MSFKNNDFPIISEAEQTPLVQRLLGIIERQAEQIQQLTEQVVALKEEVAKLKGLKGRPKIAPSRLNDPKSESKEPSEEIRPGSEKRSKKVSLEINATIRIKPASLPDGSKYLGTRDFDVQDLIIKTHNTRYQLEQWLTPDGHCISGELPQDGRRGHFGSTLISFLMYQHHHCQVTQPLLLEQVREFGTDISSGQLNHILTEGHENFHGEKDEILKVGLEVSPFVQVDDTGARHDGKNGYCTSIGNDFFAWYGSTNSKSRINFLQLLQAGKTSYHLNSIAFQYLAQEKIKKSVVTSLRRSLQQIFTSLAEWHEHLKHLGITRARHVRVVTEAALYGALRSTGLRQDLVIISDDAGQFNIPLHLHALCWIHAERAIKRLLPMNDKQRAAQDKVSDEFWYFYRSLKGYREKSSLSLRRQIEHQFDEIFKQKTDFQSLNLALQRIHANRLELLLVLDRPEIPLHNNASESDIREYVKRRKVSGGTRSECGQRSRDTFASLKKTCRKLGISFWHYLQDRLAGAGKIVRLPELIRAQMMMPRMAVASSF